MLYDDFANLLARFAQRPVPPVQGRHVYLWHGETAGLRSLLPQGLVVELDLYALAGSLPRAPFAVDEARRLLQSTITNWLQAHSPAPGVQQVILVTGNSLLMRYCVPLEAFFRVTNESRMVISVISPRETTFRPPGPLPGYVSLRPAATFEYLKAHLGEPSVIGEAIP
ncbi:MAG: hypothetical protein WBW48_17870 [Anaerolineae bacterium]